MVGPDVLWRNITDRSDSIWVKPNIRVVSRKVVYPGC
jgi:hypothetical protein